MPEELIQMENENIDEQIKAAQAEALKTGNWERYNQLSLQKQRAEAVPERVAKIESDKALFLEDYQRTEKQLEKELADPGLSFDQRQIRQNRLTNLKLNWQRNGVGDVNVVIAMRDSILGNIKEAAAMKLSPSDEIAIFGDQRAKLPQLNAIIAEANAKRLI